MATKKSSAAPTGSKSKKGIADVTAAERCEKRRRPRREISSGNKRKIEATMVGRRGRKIRTISVNFDQLGGGRIRALTQLRSSAAELQRDRPRKHDHPK